MNKWQKIAGYIIAAFGAGVVCLSLSASLGSLNEPGPGFMGFILGLSLICCAVAFIYANRSPAEKEGAAERVPLWKDGSWIKPLGAIAALVVLTFLLDVLGMIIAGLLFFLLWVKILERKSWLMAGLVAVLGTGAFYLLFHVLLRVQLPLGLLAG